MLLTFTDSHLKVDNDQYHVLQVWFYASTAPGVHPTAVTHVPRLRLLSLLIALQFALPAQVKADELPWDLVERVPRGSEGLTVFGPSGGLTIPDGRVLADGNAAFGVNNHQEPRFAAANSGRNYLFGMSVLPYVELSGRLANYPIDRPVFDALIRDLSANVKISLPKLFDAQPDIAFGYNDLGGGAQNFRSRYVAVSDRIGPVYATLGVARGVASLDGVFGGAEWALGDSGVSLLAERNSGINSAGIRYASLPLPALANARLVATVQRSFGAQTNRGADFDRSTLGIALVIPFGENARRAETHPLAWPAPSAATPGHLATRERSAGVEMPAPAALPPAVTATPIPPSAMTGAMTTAPRDTAPDKGADRAALAALQAALEQAGLERIRVGLSGKKLVIEYENHRYNQNEVDAIGIAFALGARLAPAYVKRIGVITKKAGLALYETSVDRAGFQTFLIDANPYQVIAGLQNDFRPHDDPTVDWLDRAEGRRGWSRVVLRPLINSFIGTEVGVFDYSLAASAQAIVPLWRGAEISTEYVRNVADSENVETGPFGFGRQRNGVKSALLTQSLWLNDHVLNVFSVGKLQYDYTGFQNEAILFVPGRDDQIRLEASRLKRSTAFLDETRASYSAFYRWTLSPLQTWVEFGYSRYAGNDRGPSVSVSRWFGDIEAQAYLRRSSAGITFAGLQLAFPLTPRQGMRPGLSHLEGTNAFAYGIETKLAQRGSDNRITQGVAENLQITYSARNFLLNRGRVGEDYLMSQLPRMREAALLYAPVN
ncbi:YjbH domain-containing protein [Noviherbaspirillum malthae]|uniref:YjbH domain-containing protein n=1 Tax=Noviherbaspirillum malthae TaxID=1260987 RepID=UPI00188EBE52|nr:YjbH domain-containing protein [Noviherbaspirillum malthae]